MGGDHVERLRKTYESFASEGLDLKLFTEDVEFKQPDELGGGKGDYHGRDGVQRGIEELMDVFDDVEAVPERFIESGDCVIVLVSLRGTVKRGGVPINAPFAHVWKFRGDRVAMWHAYADREQALKLLGAAE